VDRAEDVDVVVHKLQSNIGHPVWLEGRDHLMTASMGISLYPRDGADSETLIRNADIAMYQVKQSGRNDYRYFSAQLNRQALQRSRLEHQLRKALDHDELVLHYQPQIDIDSHRMIGAEALLRWKRTDEELILPGEFIPIAEETGLIIPIGHWVLRAACQQIASWQNKGLPAIPVAINVSALQFRRGDITGLILQELAGTGIKPCRFGIELTETAIMADADRAAAELGALKEAGVQIAIDDFGTGYSNLMYLKKIPADKLKIDRSFIESVGSEPDHNELVIAIIALARNLKLRVVAEGVETPAELDFLRQHGCDEVQGTMFSWPLSVKQLERSLSPSGKDRVTLR
jgi:EAL domain-containing protein (putative c-di-GMP-specific phosphodiesterase class I)